ncbi:hypothetical protein JHW43_004220 [Diplocarpon mali]|nr:hypothetical protein JHW43_004220 [Diplocarpon mali]
MGEESLVAVGESASQIRNESQSDRRRHGNLFVCVEQTLEPRSSEAAEEQRSKAGQPAGRGTRTSPMDRESGAVPPHPPAPAGRPPFPEARVPETRRRAAARQPGRAEERVVAPTPVSRRSKAWPRPSGRHALEMRSATPSSLPPRGFYRVAVAEAWA